MIIGAHTIIYSQSPEDDREFLRDVIGLPNVDVGDGWLIFGLPPSEVAVHPSEKNDVHEFFLMCDDVGAFVKKLEKLGVECAPVQDQGWGLLTQVKLPGGGKIGAYQPRHARPKPMTVGKPAKARPAKARPAKGRPAKSAKAPARRSAAKKPGRKAARAPRKTSKAARKR
jgi:hypothetical protein